MTINAMTTTETVADILDQIRTRPYNLIFRDQLLSIADRIEAAIAASAEPVAFVRPSELRDLRSAKEQGLDIASILVRLKPEPGWTVALYTHAQPAAPVSSVPEGLLTAARRLAFAARTSGGTAGHDAALCAALDEIEAILATNQGAAL